MLKRIAVYLSVALACGSMIWMNLNLLLPTPPTVPEIRGLEASARYMLSERLAPQGHPVQTERFDYADNHGVMRTYLCQFAPDYNDHRGILIFVHGASGDENEGFGGSFDPEGFHRLRVEVLNRGWHYICIRDYEFSRLLKDVRERFSPDTIYVVGQSLGGKMLLQFLEGHPDSFDGVVLACPAIAFPEFRLNLLKELTIPIVVMAGEAEPQIGPYSRQLAAFLEENGTPLLFIEYPNGDHCQPFREADWAKVLDFFHP